MKLTQTDQIIRQISLCRRRCVDETKSSQKSIKKHQSIKAEALN